MHDPTPEVFQARHLEQFRGAEPWIPIDFPMPLCVISILLWRFRS